jgi:hypothetical protein
LSVLKVLTKDHARVYMVLIKCRGYKVHVVKVLTKDHVRVYMVLIKCRGYKVHVVKVLTKDHARVYNSLSYGPLYGVYGLSIENLV